MPKPQTPMCQFLKPKDRWPYAVRCRNEPRPDGTNCEDHRDYEEEERK